MSNHVTNRLIVKGKSEDVQRLKSAVGDPGFSYHRIIPMPFELRCYSSPIYTKVNGINVRDEQTEARLLKRYGAPSWYDWAITNWGTKWDIYESGEWKDVESENSVESHIDFYSAWSPPLKVIAKLASFFPDLEIVLRYCEPGMFFAGSAMFQGECVGQNEYQGGTEEYDEIAHALGLEEMEA